MIPLVDLRAQYATIRSEIDAAIREVIAESAFVMGPAVREFENAFATYCEVPWAVGCANGTDAIQLVLRALDIVPGDEVITVPNTFIATAEAISLVGATPVFVDVDAHGLMDAGRVAATITSRTRAVVPVHLYGQVANIAAITTAAAGLPVVEDAAQAHGARRDGRRAGSLGTAATFSFYPGKNLGAYGDAGAMTFQDEALAERCAKLRDHGRNGRMDKHIHETPGLNSRLDTLQAAVLAVKLSHLDAWNTRRRTIAAWYLEQLAGTSLALPQIVAGTEPVWHLFVVHHERRDALRDTLAAEGVATGVHYPVPLHLQPAYAALGYVAGQFPVTERLARTCLSLPMYPELVEADIEHITSTLRAAL